MAITHINFKMFITYFSVFQNFHLQIVQSHSHDTYIMYLVLHTRSTKFLLDSNGSPRGARRPRGTRGSWYRGNGTSRRTWGGARGSWYSDTSKGSWGPRDGTRRCSWVLKSHSSISIPPFPSQYFSEHELPETHDGPGVDKDIAHIVQRDDVPGEPVVADIKPPHRVTITIVLCQGLLR